MLVRTLVSFVLALALVTGAGFLWTSCSLTQLDQARAPDPPPVEYVRLRRDTPEAAAKREPPRRQADVAALASLGYFGAVAASEAHGYETAAHPPPVDRERYDAIDENPFVSPQETPRSTFSVDVDTASYSNVRRYLEAGQRPPPGAVRIEELLNYFRYDYPSPRGEAPFSVTTELAEAPWNPRHRLLRIGLQADPMREADLPPRNLVFLIDVSGSMQTPDKLALVKRGLRSLAERLGSRDRVALVVYAGASGLVLPPTAGDEHAAILGALDALEAGGSTNGGAGIRLAYAVAREHFDPDAVNRVILATDGDFNVGTTSRSELIRLIEGERESGVFLTVLGVGRGNLNDADMEQLADHGNGNYAYLDTPAEARKVLVREAGGTLVTVAKDVKVQIEFNPEHVASWRLIGYENRLLAARDFDDDRKDAGEIGAGHSVTALYEIVPVDVASPEGEPPLRYQGERAPQPGLTGELAWLRLRYKAPQGDESRLLEHSIAAATTVPSDDLRFGSAVALFGMLLRDSGHVGEGDFALARELAGGAVGDDPDGLRAQFVRLAALAGELEAREPGS